MHPYRTLGFAMKPQTVIFIGPQGSGKGTQIERLDAYLRTADPERTVADIQSGRRFRSFAKDKTGYTSEHIASIMDSGRLQPLFLSVALWGMEFAENVDDTCHLLIDGFPRTTAEAVVLDTAFTLYKRDSVSVIFLDTPEEVVRERMIARARPDDTADSIEARLGWYREEVLPVVEYYRERRGAKVIAVDGTKSIDEVSSAVLQGLGI